jgi:hypothetical protein
MAPDRLRRFALPIGFFLLALLTGWLLAGVLPPGQAADEQAHAIRVDALSRGQILGHREGDRGGVTAPSTLLDVAAVTPFGHAQARAEQDKADAVRWGKPAQFFDLGTIATYFPAVYAPAAIGVAAARAVRATPAEAFRAGRLVNLATFALLGAGALAVARRGRALVAVVLLLPMSLGLAASLSGDGILIGLAALAAACATRGDSRGWWAATGLVTLIGLTKLPYAPLLLVLVAPARPRWPVRLGVAALSAGLMLGWAGYNQAEVMGIVGWPPYEAGPLWPGPPRSFDRFDSAAQLQVLAADPTRAATLPAQVLAQNPWIWRQMIGVLGWLAIEMPGWVYSMWTGALALAAAGLLAERGTAPAPAMLGLLGIALSAWAIMLAQYLGWTQVGAAVIEGVQGRYFLPLLPFLAVGIPCLRPLRLPGLDAVPLAAGFVGAMTVPVVVALASLLR